MILIVTCVVAVMLLLGCIVPSLFRRGSAFESFILLATALVIASLFVPQVFYAHYAYFSAPFLAIGLGIAFSRGVEPRRKWRVACCWGASDRHSKSGSQPCWWSRSASGRR